MESLGSNLDGWSKLSRTIPTYLVTHTHTHTYTLSLSSAGLLTLPPWYVPELGLTGESVYFSLMIDNPGGVPEASSASHHEMRLGSLVSPVGVLILILILRARMPTHFRLDDFHGGARTLNIWYVT
jgi:hypothetical protein